MYKKCKVVILPTNEKATVKDIVISPRYKGLIQLFGSFENSYKDECKVQHLFVISDDEIKIGDWFMNRQYMIETNQKEYEIWLCGDVKPNSDPHKIIASTDSSLNISALHPSFIEEYIQRYNDGNPIKDVMVEYEDKLHYEDTIYQDSNKLTPKINPDNTITIKEVKDSWNRDEVITLLKLNTERLTNSWISSDIDWINENL